MLQSHISGLFRAQGRLRVLSIMDEDVRFSREFSRSFNAYIKDPAGLNLCTPGTGVIAFEAVVSLTANIKLHLSENHCG